MAAFCGHKSDASFKAANKKCTLTGTLDPDEADTYIFPEGDALIKSRIELLDSCGLKPNQSGDVYDVIADNLTPDCDYCSFEGIKTIPVELVPLAEQHNEEFPDFEDLSGHFAQEKIKEKELAEANRQKWTCADCIEDDDDINLCRLCGDDIPYPAHAIDSKGLCPEHSGEFDYDEEEEEDMDSYLEYVANHEH